MAYGSLPDFNSYLLDAQSEVNAPTNQPATAAPEASGQGNWLTAGLGSGFHGALASVGGFGEAAARAVGLDSAADSAAGFSDRERAAAATYARKDLEDAPWYSPKALAYRVAQSVSGVGAGLAGAGAAALAAPEAGAAALIGGGLAALPLAVGENVQRSKDYYGKLSQGKAAEALALGVPEAALQSILPGTLMKPGVGLLSAVKHGVLTQAPVGAASEWLTQMMGDPNRPMGHRAQDIVSAALQGSILGGVTAGAVHPVTMAMHAVAKTPSPNLNDDAIYRTIRTALDPVQPSTEPPAPLGYQRMLPGMENLETQNPPQNDLFSGKLPDQNAPQPAQPMLFDPNAPRTIPNTPYTPPPPGGQGELNLTPEPTRQGQLDLSGSANAPGQLSLFDSIFPRQAAQPFDNGVPNPPSQIPVRPGEDFARLPAGYQPELPLNAPHTGGAERTFPNPDVTQGRQTELDFEREPDQSRLPLKGGSEQQSLMDEKGINFRELRNRGTPGDGFDQGALPVINAEHPTPQPPIKPEGPKGGPGGNDNLPPNDRTPGAQEDLAARMRDPTDPLFKAVGGNNDNTAGRGDQTREAQPQNTISMVPPGQIAPANPAAFRPASAQRPVETITTQEGLRKASMSPVQVGQETANAPANRNVEGPGPVRDATPQGDALQAAGGGKPANDVFDQTPIQADLNKLADLRKSKFATVEDAQKAVAKALVSREAAGRAAPPALERVATTLKILDDKGNIKPEFAGADQAPEGPEETLAAGPQAPEVGPRPDHSGHGPRYDDLQAIRDRLLGDNLTDPDKRTLLKRATDLQNELSNGVKGSQRTAEIIREIKGLKGDMDRREAAGLTPPVDDPKALAHSTDATPATQEFINQVQGEPAQTKEQARKNPRQPKPKVTPIKALPENIPEVNSAEPERDAMLSEGGRDFEGPGPEPQAQPQTKEAQVKAQRQAKAKPAPEPEPEPKPEADPVATKKAATQTDDDAVNRVEGIKKKKQESQTIQAVNAVKQKQQEGVLPKTPVPSDIAAMVQRVRAGLELVKANPPQNQNRLAAFNRAIAGHEEALAVLEKAGQEGGLEALQNFRRDHFSDDLWAGFSENLGPAGNAALTEHATAEADLMSRVATLRGERPLIRYESQPTQHDVNLANVIGATGKLSDALEHIRQNDPSPWNRLMATVLGKLNMDTAIRMASDDDRLVDTTRRLNQGEVIAGSHNDQLNRINVYDGSKVSQTVLHEALHAATIRAIKAGTAGARDLVNLWKGLVARHGDSKFYGLSSPEELVAEASNPQFQQFLKSEPWQVNGVKDVWQAFKNGMFKALGMPERARNAFDQLMDTTNKLMGENPTQAPVVGERAMMAQRGLKQVGDAIDKLGAMGGVELTREAENAGSRLKEGARNGILGWTDSLNIGKIWSTHLPQMLDYVLKVNEKHPRADTLSKTEVSALHIADGLSKETKKVLSQVMAENTLRGYDSTKTWAENKHLHDHPNAKGLEQMHAETVNRTNQLRRMDGGKGIKAYEALRDNNDFKTSMRNIHMQQDYVRNFAPEVAADPAFSTDAIRDYEAQYALQDNPTNAKAWARAREAAQREVLKAHQTDLLDARDKASKAVKDNERLGLSKDPAVRATKLTGDARRELEDAENVAKARLKTVRSVVNDVDNLNTRTAQRPYFHIGRDDGEHFVAADLAKDDNGIVKPEAIQALADALGGGFKDVKVMEGLTSDKFYVRVRSTSERDLMMEALKPLAQKGHLENITRGLAYADNVFNSLAPDHIRQMVAAAKAAKPDIPDGVSPQMAQRINDAHEAHVQEFMRSAMEMIPKTGLMRLYQHREGAQGFNQDMIKNFRQGGVSNSRGLANLTMAHEVGAAMKSMKDGLKALNGSSKINEAQLTAVSQATAELLARNQSIKTYSTASFMDYIRQATHLFAVGMSPAYSMMLAGQIPTLSWPQLGAVHGFVRSAQSLAGVTNDTFKMVSAIAKSADRSTFGVRYETLKNSGMSDRDIEFHLDMARRGIYSQGYSESMTGHDTSGVMGKAKHYANMMGRYSEMVPRVQLALAARNLFEADMKAGKKVMVEGREFTNANDYAHYAVEEAQLNWNPSLNARQMTRGGVFGVMSPVINQFMGFQTRLTSKLYREVHGALGGDRQSQKWLLAHAAAVATLSGTLGLPMVSVAASVYDKLADWVTGKDDHDVIASYRTYLANTFGKETGEVIARGAPRALGIDFDHAGEGKILPGSTTLMMLTEKRKMEDAEADWLKAEAGHAVGFVAHVASAMRDLSNHDWLDASEKLVPELFKGPLDAYRLNERGFVDRNGQKLPITANATDVMMTAMGIDPAKEEEYREEQRTLSGLNTMRTLRSQNITRHLLLAQSRGDGQMFQDWQREAMQFSQDHPGMSGPLQSFGRELSQHLRSTALARGFGVPIGVNRRDSVARGMTAFGNLRNQ